MRRSGTRFIKNKNRKGVKNEKTVRIGDKELEVVDSYKYTLTDENNKMTKYVDLFVEVAGQKVLAKTLADSSRITDSNKDLIGKVAQELKEYLIASFDKDVILYNDTLEGEIIFELNTTQREDDFPVDYNYEYTMGNKVKREGRKWIASNYPETSRKLRISSYDGYVIISWKYEWEYDENADTLRKELFNLGYKPMDNGSGEGKDNYLKKNTWISVNKKDNTYSKWTKVDPIRDDKRYTHWRDLNPDKEEEEVMNRYKMKLVPNES